MPHRFFSIVFNTNSFDCAVGKAADTLESEDVSRYHDYGALEEHHDQVLSCSCLRMRRPYSGEILKFVIIAQMTLEVLRYDETIWNDRPDEM